MLKITIIFLFAVLFAGCNNTVSLLDSEAEFAVQLTASDIVVTPGSTSLVTSELTGNIPPGKLRYVWIVYGNYGYIVPMDSICIFASPLCHYGPATLTVTVSDENGASATSSINLN